MKTEEAFQSGFWHVRYTAGDGGRLTRLSYKDQHLLTTAPESFRAPQADYGVYESRPVFGYDDCFPTVETCRFPEMEWDVPDHGEICWLPWSVHQDAGLLVFRVGSRSLPIVFERKLMFSEKTLTWQFRVMNTSARRIPFQHIMHPLMPVQEITRVHLPACACIFDERADEAIPVLTPLELENLLLRQPIGTARMLFAQGISEGKMGVTFRGGLGLKIIFPHKLFPTLGLWWNKGGYPAEEGCRRYECAFEPTPGGTSRLDVSFREGCCQVAAPGDEVKWSVVWEMEDP